MGTADTIAAQPYPQYNGPQLADFNSTQNTAFQQAANISQAGAPMMTSAQNTLNSASNQNIPGAVAPYAAASTMAATPQGIQSYMSPYLNSTLSGIANLAQQNWNEFTAPSVNNSFISAGQYGSGRNAEVMGQQANLADQALTANLASAANSAYSTAGTQAASQAAALQGAGNLMGTATQQQGALQTAAGSAQGALGQQAQNMALQQASANQAVGNQQQAQTQSNLNLAYQQFMNQAMWPQTQAEFMNQIIQGLPSPGTSTSTSSNTPASPFTTFSPTQVATPTLSTIIGTGATSGLAKGGRVKHPEGALSAGSGAAGVRVTADGGVVLSKVAIAALIGMVKKMVAQAEANGMAKARGISPAGVAPGTPPTMSPMVAQRMPQMMPPQMMRGAMPPRGALSMAAGAR